MATKTKKNILGTVTTSLIWLMFFLKLEIDELSAVEDAEEQDHDHQKGITQKADPEPLISKEG